MTQEKFKILVDGFYGLFTACIVCGTLYKMWQDYNKRIVDVAKENSTGAADREKMKAEIQMQGGLISDLRSDQKKTTEKVDGIDRKVDTALQNYQNIVQQLMASFNAFVNK